MRFDKIAGGIMLISVGLVGAAGPTSAAPAADVMNTATEAKTNAECVYHVRFNDTPVRENPDNSSPIRKYKSKGEKVTGPCREHYDVEGTTWYTAVHCSCAKHGYGWIPSNWLRY